MRPLLGAFASLLMLNSVSAQTDIAAEYVSIDCPKGDITLELNPNRTFRLELRHWDSENKRHTYTEQLAGTWQYASGVLTLRRDTDTRYRRKKTSLRVGAYSEEIDSFVWQDSVRPTFADGFTLVERKTIDALRLRATPR